MLPVLVSLAPAFHLPQLDELVGLELHLQLSLWIRTHELQQPVQMLLLRGYSFQQKDLLFQQDHAPLLTAGVA